MNFFQTFSASRRVAVAAVLAVACLSANNLTAQDDDPIFSGPQVGESLVKFETERFGGGEDQTTSFDVVSEADGGPVVLLFMHQFNRPSFGLMRSVVEYTKSLKEEGVNGAVIYLTEDPTAMTAQLTRARGALPKDFKIGIFKDGQEGPGAYGLNRNVTMTVLVGKGDEVTANFALVQPSLQADGYKIVNAIAETAGVEAPEREAFERMAMRRNRGTSDVPDRMQLKMRDLISPVIQKDASEEAIAEAAKKLEDEVAKDAELRMMVGDAARRIVNSGRLATYGNEHSQAFIKKWAEEFK